MKNIFPFTRAIICLFLFSVSILHSQSGNVGIGTTNPTEKLEVNGSVRIGQGPNDAPQPGTVRYNQLTGDFEGFNGFEWKSLTKTNSWGFQVSEENQALAPLVSGRMGHHVALSGNYAIVGDPDDNTNGNQAGAAFIYEFQDGEWELMEKVFPLDPAAGDLFGYSVSLSGNLAMIGAPYKDEGVSDGGAVYVFYNFLGDWSQADKFAANDPVESGLFGYSVSMEGTVGMIGAPNNLVSGVSSGAVYVFEQDFFETTWSQTGKLFAINGDADSGDNFGYSVILKDTLTIIGALTDSEGGVGAGAAYVFKRNPDLSWSQQAKLIASNASGSSFFGNTVSVDQGRVAVGSQSGSAYLFSEIAPGNWAEEARIVSPKPGDSDSFGRTVAVSGSNLVVGAYSANGVNPSQGCAYVFGFSGTQWSMAAKLEASDAGVNDAQFGYSVDVKDGFILVGAPIYGLGGKTYFFQK